MVIYGYYLSYICIYGYNHYEKLVHHRRAFPLAEMFDGETLNVDLNVQLMASSLSLVGSARNGSI